VCPPVLAAAVPLHDRREASTAESIGLPSRDGNALPFEGLTDVTFKYATGVLLDVGPGVVEVTNVLDATVPLTPVTYVAIVAGLRLVAWSMMANSSSSSAMSFGAFVLTCAAIASPGAQVSRSYPLKERCAMGLSSVYAGSGVG
jgi:hypothetical protein